MSTMNTKITKPMLAGKVEDVNKLQYPVYCTPKLDGIRCLKLDGKVLSRKFKEIPNQYIKSLVSQLPDGLDGELMTGGSFQETTSKVMSEEGHPEFKYYVFDYVKDSLDRPYRDRMEDLKALSLPDFVVKVLPVTINKVEDLLLYERECLASGYEGVMIRSGNGPYKLGRSTTKEGYLLKLKRFEDAEAIIIGFEEKMHNENEAEKDALGHTKRSQAKAGMIPAGTLGTLIVRDLKTNIEFGIGSGLSDSIRNLIWKNKEQFLNKIIKYKYQPTGIKEAPRFPVFLGFRSENDMD